MQTRFNYLEVEIKSFSVINRISGCVFVLSRLRAQVRCRVDALQGRSEGGREGVIRRAPSRTSCPKCKAQARFRVHALLLEERRRHNARGEAEVNATRFPSYEVRMSTDRVYGTVLEACVAGMVMGRRCSSDKRTPRNGTGSASRAHRGAICSHFFWVWAPTSLGPHPSGPPRFGPTPLWAPTLRSPSLPFFWVWAPTPLLHSPQNWPK